MLPVSKLAMPIAAAFLALATLSHTAHGACIVRPLSPSPVLMCIDLHDHLKEKDALGIKDLKLKSTFKGYVATGTHPRAYTKCGSPSVNVGCGNKDTDNRFFKLVNGLYTAPAGSDLHNIRDIIPVVLQKEFEGHTCYVVCNHPGQRITMHGIVFPTLENSIPIILPKWRKDYVIIPAAGTLNVNEEEQITEITDNGSPFIFATNEGKYISVPDKITLTPGEKANVIRMATNDVISYHGKGINIAISKDAPDAIIKGSSVTIVKKLSTPYFIVDKKELLGIFEQIVEAIRVMGEHGWYLQHAVEEAYYNTATKRVTFPRVDQIMRVGLSDVKAKRSKKEVLATNINNDLFALLSALHAFTHYKVTLDNVNDLIATSGMKLSIEYRDLLVTVPARKEKAAPKRTNNQP
ncbi:hypothetical protein SYNPS1DRAFT_26634 [Syncephalis pseudoplumigaleata]|uniref:Uncharacterized protein n=1 Tax=Syncephalis pseudoplumigaleata TaxID=1712513 RepID=A0A4P9Z546_9FUNG|nr:hypothetical protein SYNPS1DRAFT_26634 [Syncephalis pseudoplumigaleata]|eukprot:RKP27734.1 hypothetical protein SYNPS1DRAFT_26634 [Syncephalis pseudoplumigaleata]